jgi:uncharacterized short protein YbdD (DUF466 family)
VSRVLDEIGRVLRAVLGVPDYAKYVEHCRLHHPGEPLLTHDEFLVDRLDCKYSQPGSRCC